ncbi:hypothetical protein CYMTET_9559 [Cymbomonas tetramitiformis]|uniref:Uncharacterized protein n=1 Tax=Cymbomonas tetramitiformis TaxID=36881 RepID=A0AAE0GR79_9CHLO|nr:hypothetical protein CYMTET_9559 [Cymbomonas tetramitiformis]
MENANQDPGAVGKTGADGFTHLSYDDGDKEHLDMDKAKYEVVSAAAVHHVSSWDAAFQALWRGELGDSSHTDLAVQMQQAAWGDKTVGNYWPKAQVFMQFCAAEGRAGVWRAVKGMSSPQVQAADEQGEARTVRTWLPARCVSAVHARRLGTHPVGRAEMELLRACAYVVFAFVTFGRADTGVYMLRTHVSITGDTVSRVLHKQKGGRHVRLKRSLTIPTTGMQGWCSSCSIRSRAVGTAIERYGFLGGWSRLSSAIHSYVDLTAVPAEHMEQYFGWTTPRWREQQPGTEQCA